jgi:hypothetical protein
LVIINNKISGKAYELAMPPKYAKACRVECANPQPFGLVVEKSFQPMFHLIGGFVGEGNGEDILRSRPFTGDKVGNAVRKDSRLPTSCAR